MGQWSGPTGPPQWLRQAKHQRPALSAGQEGLPHTEWLDCKNPDVLPALTQSAPWSCCSPPRPQPRPTSESKTFQPAKPGPGVLSKCLPRTPGPWPKRAPRANLLPTALEVGEAAATHSTKCWHLHPKPGRQLTDSYRVVTSL